MVADTTGFEAWDRRGVGFEPGASGRGRTEGRSDDEAIDRTGNYRLGGMWFWTWNRGGNDVRGFRNGLFSNNLVGSSGRASCILGGHWGEGLTNCQVPIKFQAPELFRVLEWTRPLSNKGPITPCCGIPCPSGGTTFLDDSWHWKPIQLSLTCSRDLSTAPSPAKPRLPPPTQTKHHPKIIPNCHHAQEQEAPRL